MSEREEQLRKALLVASGWLNALAIKYDLDEDKTTAKLTHNGESLGETTLAEALDMADAALEPPTSGDRSEENQDAA